MQSGAKAARRGPGLHRSLHRSLNGPAPPAEASGEQPVGWMGISRGELEQMSQLDGFASAEDAVRPHTAPPGEGGWHR